MADTTPERLKAFRAEYDQGGTSSVRWVKAQFVVMIAGFFSLIALQVPAIRSTLGMGQSSTLRDNESLSQRELAVYLAEKNLPAAAIDVYRDHLTHEGLSAAERATICFTVAKLAMETEQYDMALRYLYEAEWLAPEAEWAPDLAKKIVLCLDRLGRSETLRRELRARGDIHGGTKALQPGEIVLAEFGDEVITDRDLTRELDKLPAAARQGIASAEEKTEFLRNLVAERLLLDKARRLELDKDPEVQELLERQIEGLMVRKLIDAEVRSQLQITDADAERYYKAEIDRYTTRASAVGTAGTGATREEALAATQNGQKAAIQAGSMRGVELPAEAGSRLAAAILALPPGEVAEVVEHDNAWYAFVGELTAAKVAPYDEVRDAVMSRYRLEKEQEQIAALIESTLQARQVKLYPERLKSEATE